ncbi:MAG: hypothetical protein JNIBNLAF_01275 [Nitrosomonas europaea]|nr:MULTISPECIES: hypothetical protein [Nitrosomonas]MBV6389628.1 hypothetical protein [Nitrosomonas europaea]
MPNLSGVLKKFVAASGINALIGEKVVGIGALFTSGELGGY